MKTLTLILLLTAGFVLRAADVPALPRIVDLGAGKCIPCKQMKPILAELTQEYAGQFEVVFIDVWENRSAGEPYGIRIIPTQIFFSADGKELFRHEGFMAKKDILAKWKELGVALKEPVARTN
ncbi:MAG: thioredoxin family protein [Verrucomicrobia bacterium]|nr:thioredoxin family protein [Verrucomicrobiota bacterium]